MVCPIEKQVLSIENAGFPFRGCPIWDRKMSLENWFLIP